MLKPSEICTQIKFRKIVVENENNVFIMVGKEQHDLEMIKELDYDFIALQ